MTKVSEVDLVHVHSRSQPFMDRIIVQPLRFFLFDRHFLRLLRSTHHHQTLILLLALFQHRRRIYIKPLLLVYSALSAASQAFSACSIDETRALPESFRPPASILPSLTTLSLPMACRSPPCSRRTPRTLRSPPSTVLKRRGAYGAICDGGVSLVQHVRSHCIWTFKAMIAGETDTAYRDLQSRENRIETFWPK